MFHAPVIILLLSLAACGSDLFDRNDTPRTATELQYAKEVCEQAGRQSRACIDARHQMDLQCFRTIGTVDCYRTNDPFGNAYKERSTIAALDRRTAPQPLATPVAEPAPEATPQSEAAAPATVGTATETGNTDPAAE